MTLAEWGSEMLAECAPIAAALDAANGGDCASRSARGARSPRSTIPPRRRRHAFCESMARDHGNSYVRFVLAQSLAHRDTHPRIAVSRRSRRALCAPGRRIVTEQRAIEAADTLPFESYRQLYLGALSPERLGNSGRAEWSESELGSFRARLPRAAARRPMRQCPTREPSVDRHRQQRGNGTVQTHAGSRKLSRLRW